MRILVWLALLSVPAHAGRAVMEQLATTNNAVFIDTVNARLGVSTATPATALDVAGDAQIGRGATKSTFSATGALALASGAGLTLSGSSGVIVTASSITAGTFYGDGSHISNNTPSSAAGGDLTGTYPNPNLNTNQVQTISWLGLQTFAQTPIGINVTKNATFGSSVTTAGAFFGDASHLSGVFINTQSSSYTNTSAGGLLAVTSVTAGAFFGDGSHLLHVATFTTNGIGSMPAGTILTYFANPPPGGTVECNGLSYATTFYPVLYAAIGCNAGCADGTHFNVPDLRGVFLRGWNHAFGSTTAYVGDPDAVSRSTIAVGGATGDNIGSYQDGRFQIHSHVVQTAAHSVVTGGGGSNGGPTAGENSAETGGDETRPKNMYVLYAIKTDDNAQLSAGISLTGSTGTLTSQSSVTASAFFGDGSHLTGLAAAEVLPNVAITTAPNNFTDNSTTTFRAPITITSTLTVSGAVTMSTLNVNGAIAAGPITATGSVTSVLFQSPAGTTRAQVDVQFKAGNGTGVGGGQANLVGGNGVGSGDVGGNATIQGGTAGSGNTNGGWIIQRVGPGNASGLPGEVWIGTANVVINGTFTVTGPITVASMTLTSANGISLAAGSTIAFNNSTLSFSTDTTPSGTGTHVLYVDKNGLKIAGNGMDPQSISTQVFLSQGPGGNAGLAAFMVGNSSFSANGTVTRQTYFSLYGGNNLTNGPVLQLAGSEMGGAMVGPIIDMIVASGTFANPQQIQNIAANLQIGAVQVRLSTGTTLLTPASILFTMDSAGINPTGAGATSESFPTNISFRTTPSGSVSTSERMRLTSTGTLAIGLTAPTATFLQTSGLSATQSTSTVLLGTTLGSQSNQHTAVVVQTSMDSSAAPQTALWIRNPDNTATSSDARDNAFLRIETERDQSSTLGIWPSIYADGEGQVGFGTLRPSGAVHISSAPKFTSGFTGIPSLSLRIDGDSKVAFQQGPGAGIGFSSTTFYSTATVFALPVTAPYIAGQTTHDSSVTVNAAFAAGSNSTFTVTTAGAYSAPSQPYFQIAGSATQVIPTGAFTTFFFGSNTKTNNAGWVSTSSGVVTLPIAGQYFLRCRLKVPAITATDIELEPVKNGSSAACPNTACTYGGNITIAQPLTCDCATAISANDTVGCRILQNSGGNVSLSPAGESFIEGWKLF